MDDAARQWQTLKPFAGSLQAAGGVKRPTITPDTGKHFSASQRESRVATVRAVLIGVTALMLFGIGLWEGWVRNGFHPSPVQTTQSTPAIDAGV